MMSAHEDRQGRPGPVLIGGEKISKKASSRNWRGKIQSLAIYNRALRQDPTLQGKVVLELVIDPAGRVVGCNVKATELADQSLLSKIVNRVRMFDFGRKDVRTTTISYPVHFLPT